MIINLLFGECHANGFIHSLRLRPPLEWRARGRLAQPWSEAAAVRLCSPVEYAPQSGVEDTYSPQGSVTLSGGHSCFDFPSV